MNYLERTVFMKSVQQLVALRRRKWRGDESPALDVLPYWRRLGHGHYGEAWVHEHYLDLVVKIGGRAGWGRDRPIHWDEYSHSTSDVKDAWGVFAKVCTRFKYRHIRWLPEYHVVEQVTEGITYAIMPRYLKKKPHSTNIFVLQEDARVHTNSDWFLELKNDVQDELQLKISDDMHYENVMWCPVRENLIITDPFCTVQNPNYKQRREQNANRF